MEVASFQYQSFTVYYRVQGTGFPILLLHGFGEDSTVWDNQLPVLANRMVIRPDWPGSGLSVVEVDKLTEPEVASLCTLNFYAAIADALLQHLAIKACIVFGHSMGGYITMAFVEQYAHYLKGFGLVHSLALPDSPERKEKREKGIALIGKYGGYEFLKTSIPNLFASPYRQNEQAKIATLVEKARAFDSRILQYYYVAIKERPDRIEVLRASKVPVLMIAGKDDTVALLDDVLKQSHVPDTCYLLLLDNTAHMGIWEAIDKLNPFISKYIVDMLEEA